MHRLDPRKANAPMARGVEGKTETSKAIEFSGISGGQVKPDLLATHFCCCKPGAPCIFCHRWDRTIRGIEARRSDSLRRQAMGEMLVGG